MAASPVRLGINGAAGRVGQALLKLVVDDERFTLRHAVVGPQSPHIGKPIAAGAKLVYQAAWDDADDLDVVVDFSSPAGLAATLDYCLARKVALVTGTTGMDADLRQKIVDAGRHIAVLESANFSLGVAVLTRLLRQAASLLAGWDLEILELHHGHKQDAPSGTALALGRAAAAARDVELDAKGVFVRHGHTGEREPGSIGFATLRGGDVVGEHVAMLLGQGERVELAHRATDRTIFARGALTAAAWLAQREPGCYDIETMLGG